MGKAKGESQEKRARFFLRGKKSLWVCLEVFERAGGVEKGEMVAVARKD